MTFLNGKSILECEKGQSIEYVISYRILFEYFVAGRTESEKNKFHIKFEDFIVAIWKSEESRCSLSDTLNVIQNVQRKRNPVNGPLMIYLGIDEYQYFSKELLQELVTSLGRIMSTSTDFFLAPYFTGTDFNKIHTSIVGSRYRAVDLPFLLIEETEICHLLDELSKEYRWLEKWRTWSEFRKLIEKFQGYMRGIEFFLEEMNEQNQILNSQSEETTEHFSKHVLTLCFENAKTEITKRLHPEGQGKIDYSTLMRKILLQVPVDPSDQAPIDAKLTYQDLENIGLVVLQPLKTGDDILQIPHIFGEIFTSKVSSSVSSISQFMNVEYWQEWETFNVCYLSFRHNLIVEEYKHLYEDGFIPLSILFGRGRGSPIFEITAFRLQRVLLFASCAWVCAHHGKRCRMIQWVFDE